MVFFSSISNFFNSFYSANSLPNDDVVAEIEKSKTKAENGSIARRKSTTNEATKTNGHAQNGVEKRPPKNLINLRNIEKEEKRTKRENENEGDGGWFLRQSKPWWAWLAIWILKLGPMPRHIAFVMDGNRRFARQSQQCKTVLDGHMRGFEQLTKVLDWCDWFEVAEMTVYAFSIENFKRPNEEVAGLMELAEQKLKQLLESSDQLAERKLRIQFFGNRKLLPEQIQKLIEQIEALACGRECSTSLNICLAYTSTDEITRAFEEIRQKVQSGQIDEDEIDRQLINAHLDTRDSLPLDMFVRTSEQRLSDFMLFQIRNSTYLHFEPDVLWPEFGLRHLLSAILHFQMARVQLAQWQQEKWFPRMEMLREYYDGMDEEEEGEKKD